MKLKYLFVLSCLIIVFSISCEKQKKNAFGSYYHIFVLTQTDNIERIKPFFDTYAQITRITPQKEKIFHYHYIDSLRFRKSLDRRHIVIASSLDARGFAGDVTRQMLSEDAQKMIKERGVAFFVKEDLWAKNQTVAFFVGSDFEMLTAAVELYGGQFSYIIDEKITVQLKDAVLSDRFRWEERQVEKQIEAEYGFHIGVPHGYEWEKGKAEDNFIWLRHLAPEQWIFVYKSEIPEKSIIDSSSSAIDSFSIIKSIVYSKNNTDYFSFDNFRNLRDSLCAIYYESDEIDSIVSVERDLEIGGLPAWRIRGLWKNTKSIVGGPYVSYVAYDFDNNTRYLIDAATFAPGTTKEKYLRQVHSALLSFNPKPEK